MSSTLHKSANVISSYARQVVTTVIGIVVTRMIIRELGLEAYGSIYFLIQLGSIVEVFGNALSGAASRYVAQCVARGEKHMAGSYLSHTIMAVGGVGILCMLGFSAYAILSPTLSQTLPVLLVAVVMTAIVTSALANILSVGNFVTERFVSRSVTQILSRVAYFGFIWIALFAFRAGVWAVGGALMIESSVAFGLFLVLYRRILPDVAISFRNPSLTRLLEILHFVGWMLVAYCGMYITRSGVLMAVERYGSKDDLGRFALAMQINAMILQVLQTFSLVTSPSIYRALAVGRNREASALLERYLLMVTLIGGLAVIFLALDGPVLLQVWLGSAAPSSMRLMLLGTGFSALVMGWGTGISVYLAGANRIRTYGMATLVAGLSVVAMALALLQYHPEQMVWVVFFPGLAELIKYSIQVFYIDREAFCLAERQDYFRKSASLIMVLLPAAVCWWVAHRFCPAPSLGQFAVRCAAAGIPLAWYVGWRLCRDGLLLRYHPNWGRLP